MLNPNWTTVGVGLFGQSQAATTAVAVFGTGTNVHVIQPTNREVVVDTTVHLGYVMNLEPVLSGGVLETSQGGSRQANMCLRTASPPGFSEVETGITTTLTRIGASSFN